VLSNLYLIMVGGNPLQYAEYVLQTEVGPGPFTLTPKDWTVVATSIVLILITGFLLQRTRYGTALRAVSDNPDLASSSGIAVERVILITWIGGAALAASGGVFLGIATAVSWDMGLEMLLLLFAAVILGGIGTVYGAVLGALLIGIVTQVSTYWINPEAKNAVAFLVLIGVLLVRPQGILGRRERVG
jgi:branched-chain amino acid transport system permease protein